MIFPPSRTPTVPGGLSVVMYNSTLSVSPDPAFRSTAFPTVPISSVTGRPRECAWCGGSPWGSLPGPGRRCGARSRLLSWYSSCVLPRFPAAFYIVPSLLSAGFGSVFKFRCWFSLETPRRQIFPSNRCAAPWPSLRARAQSKMQPSMGPS